VPQTIYQVNAFTDDPASGNPAGVCVLEKPAGGKWMQAAAQKMKFSETAFLHAEQSGYRLRWFTPRMEIDLCGHATLASAHILWEKGFLDPAEEALFYTRGGTLTARKDGNWIELDFPAKSAVPCEAPEGLEACLGTTLLTVGRNDAHYLAEVESEEVLRGLRPDFNLMESFLDKKRHGVIVTCLSSKPAFDFVSRFFAPAAGISEDPVTGSAHCCLGPFWSSRLGKKSFTAFQASSRGGVVKVRCIKDRVFLGGQALTLSKFERE